jgi:hypothetical protein
MSNELTPQEKYPKFYKDPHLWIGAIEVEAINTASKIGVDLVLQGDRIKLDAGNCYLLNRNITTHHLLGFKPLFKPQEGDQFIKDLESAVRVALPYKWSEIELVQNENMTMVFINGYDGIYIAHDNIGTIATNRGSDVNNGNWDFDCAAYVDTLRKLGYYL